MNSSTICDCGRRPTKKTSWTNMNHIQRLIRCPRYLGPGACEFWRWINPPMCQRSRVIMLGLLRKINKLEEELTRAQKVENSCSFTRPDSLVVHIAYRAYYDYMLASGDSWVREYNESVKLADDITNMISERSSLPVTGPEAQRHSSAIRRKITILGTRLDSLQSLLSKLPGKQKLTEKEMNRRRDMAANLRSKVNQMASSLNMSSFAIRDSLLGPEAKQPDAMSRTTGLDNHGVVGLQRTIMREQDEDLEKLEETVISTKHIALAVNEELDLHTRLIDNLDEHVEVTDSRLQRVQKRLAILNAGQRMAAPACAYFCQL